MKTETVVLCIDIDAILCPCPCRLNILIADFRVSMLALEGGMCGWRTVC